MKFVAKMKGTGLPVGTRIDASSAGHYHVRITLPDGRQAEGWHATSYWVALRQGIRNLSQEGMEQ